MKRIAKFTVLLGMMCTLLVSGSCSSDDNDASPENPENPEDNLPEEAKTFVGFWENQGNRGGDFIFFEDGTCWMMPIYNGEHTESYIDGYWTYDTSTKILATTTKGWQWQVTLSNPEAWTGVSLGSNPTSQTFERKHGPKYMNIFLANSSWEESADSVLNIKSHQTLDLYSHSIDGFFITSTIKIGDASFLKLIEDDNTDDYTCKYDLSEIRYIRQDTYYEYVIGSGTVTLKNPTSSPTKGALVFTGYINKTMSRKSQSDH